MTSPDLARHVQLQVLGTGCKLPGNPLTTDELLAHAQRLSGTASTATAAAIAKRLGIHRRHLARPLAAAIEAPRAADRAPALAAAALRHALAGAQLEPAALSWLVGHTTTPHTCLPSNTAWVADELAFAGAHAELRQACTGFASALLMMSPHVEQLRGVVAIVGSELGSTLFDFGALAEDRSQWVNLVQMGDGAGAIVLGPLTGPRQSRIEFAFFGCRGLDTQPGIGLPEGGSGSPALSKASVPLFRHDFAAVRRDGLELLREGMITIGAAGYSFDDFAWIIPHQANGRMREICHSRLGLPAERIVCDAHELGNLGSAAIWVSFDRLRRSGRLRPGERVLVLGAEASKFMFGGFVYTHGSS